MTKDVIAETLGIKLDDSVSLEPVKTEAVETIESVETDTITEILGPEVNPLPHQEEDYNFTRETLKKIVDKSIKALDDVMDVAEEDATPRAYEVVAKLLDSAAKITQDFYDLQKRHKDIIQSPLMGASGKMPINVEQGVIFAGDSKSTLQAIRERKKLRKEAEESDVPE